MVWKIHFPLQKLLHCSTLLLASGKPYLSKLWQRGSKGAISNFAPTHKYILLYWEPYTASGAGRSRSTPTDTCAWCPPAGRRSPPQRPGGGLGSIAPFVNAGRHTMGVGGERDLKEKMWTERRPYAGHRCHPNCFTWICDALIFVYIFHPYEYACSYVCMQVNVIRAYWKKNTEKHAKKCGLESGLIKHFVLTSGK